MKKISVVLSMFALIFPFADAGGSSFEDEATPVEREDIKTIEKINNDNSFNKGETTIEKDDFTTIDQINRDSDFEEEETLIEREDIKSINQLR